MNNPRVIDEVIESVAQMIISGADISIKHKEQYNKYTDEGHPVIVVTCKRTFHVNWVKAVWPQSQRFYDHMVR